MSNYRNTVYNYYPKSVKENLSPIELEEILYKQDEDIYLWTAYIKDYEIFTNNDEIVHAKVNIINKYSADYHGKIQDFYDKNSHVYKNMYAMKINSNGQMSNKVTIDTSTVTGIAKSYQEAVNQQYLEIGRLTKIINSELNKKLKKLERFNNSNKLMQKTVF